MNARLFHSNLHYPMRCPMLLAVLTGLLLALHPHSGIAADDKKADREARRAEMLEQRYAQERTAWQQEKADLTQKLAEAQASAGSLKTQSDKVSDDLNRSTSDRASLQKKLVDAQKQLAETKSAADKAAAADKTKDELMMRARQQERVAQSARYDTQAAALGICTDKNERLLQVSHELLQRYRNKGVIDALRQADPVLGFKDVEIFNQVQEYRDRIDTEAIAPSGAVKP